MIAPVRKVAALDASDVRLIGRAFCKLARVRVSLWTRPWRPRVSVARSVRVVAARPDVDRLAWAVRAASRCVPGATCLTQALGLQRLLFDFGYDSVVQVGIRHVNGKFTAHAWVEHEGRPIVVAPADLARYTRFFVWPESRPNRP